MSSLFGSRFGSRPKGDEAPQETPPPRQLANPRPTTFSQQPLGFETVLGTGSALEGKLKSEGNIRLDGIFTGTLEISGNVLVGETATINADIDAKNISIAGAVRGNVSGNKVQLLRTGKVWGNITASALTTEEGAFIDGKISMHAAPPIPTAPEPVQENTPSANDEDITLPSIPAVTDELIVDVMDDEDGSLELPELDDTNTLLGVKDPDFIENGAIDDIIDSLTTDDNKRDEGE